MANTNVRLAIAFALAACRSTPTAATESPCPGPYAITPGTCTVAATREASECHGVCGFVLHRGDCRPLRATILAANHAAGTDPAGRFELPALALGHYQLRVRAD